MTLSIKKHKARKWHKCDSCESNIAPEKEYYRLFGGVDGCDLHEMKLCSQCHFHLESGNFEENDAYQDKFYRELDMYDSIDSHHY